MSDWSRLTEALPRVSENPNWSVPVSDKLRPLGCDWSWCWRDATRMSRAWVSTGGVVVTFGRHHCERHTRMRLAMNRQVRAALTEEDE